MMDTPTAAQRRIHDCMMHSMGPSASRAQPHSTQALEQPAPLVPRGAGHVVTVDRQHVNVERDPDGAVAVQHPFDDERPVRRADCTLQLVTRLRRADIAHQAETIERALVSSSRRFRSPSWLAVLTVLDDPPARLAVLRGALLNNTNGVGARGCVSSTLPPTRLEDRDARCRREGQHR